MFELLLVKAAIPPTLRDLRINGRIYPTHTEYLRLLLLPRSCSLTSAPAWITQERPNTTFVEYTMSPAS